MSFVSRCPGCGKIPREHYADKGCEWSRVFGWSEGELRQQGADLSTIDSISTDCMVADRLAAWAPPVASDQGPGDDDPEPPSAATG